MKFINTQLYKFSRLNVLWVVFYLLIVIASTIYLRHLYNQHDEDQLPSGYIELLVSKTSYQLGETVEFLVVNRFPTPVYVTNHCPGEPLDVYRWESNSWIQIHDSAIGGRNSCINQERNVAIESNTSRLYDFSEWPNLFNQPGVYRIAVTLDHYSDMPFQDFTVLEPPKHIEILEDLTYTKPPTLPVSSTQTKGAPAVDDVVFFEEVIIEEVQETEEENEDTYEDEYGEKNNEEEDDDD